MLDGVGGKSLGELAAAPGYSEGSPPPILGSLDPPLRDRRGWPRQSFDVMLAASALDAPQLLARYAEGRQP